MKTIALKPIINEALKTAMSYEEYKTLIDDLLQEHKSTAPIQEESLTEYSLLNQRRMKRWEKTLKISPRPTTATQLVNAYKQKHGQLDAGFKEDLQRWYNQDKGQTTIEDIQALLS